MGSEMCIRDRIRLEGLQDDDGRELRMQLLDIALQIVPVILEREIGLLLRSLCELVQKGPLHTRPPQKNATTNGQTRRHIAGLLAIC